MGKVAFFVDGAFFFRQVVYYQAFFCTGQAIREYCEKHLGEDEQIFRIFYYDAEPMEARKGITPRGKEVFVGGYTDKRREFFTSIRHTPFMDLRLGKITWHNDWILTEGAQRALSNGTKSLDSLQDSDFVPNQKQKAVDMQIGMDIAKVAYKKLADRIVLITGDSDFVPTAIMARSEGICVTLDPMCTRIAEDLIVNVDYVKCVMDEYGVRPGGDGSEATLYQNPKSL